jgi:hypothetical protein
MCQRIHHKYKACLHTTHRPVEPIIKCRRVGNNSFLTVYIPPTDTIVRVDGLREMCLKDLQQRMELIRLHQAAG